MPKPGIIRDEYSMQIKSGTCPICQTKISHLEGCVECLNCGWSLCEEG